MFDELPPMVSFPLVKFEPIVIFVVSLDELIAVDFNDVIVSVPWADG